MTTTSSSAARVPAATCNGDRTGRQPAAGGASSLARLLAADGRSTPSAGGEQAWTEYVARWISLFGAGPGTSVWQVGCGAGAFLYPFYERGCSVGGTDLSPSLIAEASAVMPAGRFSVQGAPDDPAVPPADLVVSSVASVRFGTPGYSEAVVRRLVARARRAVLITDIPDHAARDPEPGHRGALARGASEGRPSFPRQYRARDWLTAALRAAGLPRVAAESQFFAGSGDAPGGCSVWGWCE